MKNQFRWVVLLLSSAVILPTVCVLWFMGQAVSNTRSAARQQQMEAVSQSLQDLKQQTNQAWLTLADLRAQVDALDDTELFRSLLAPRDLGIHNQVLHSRCIAGGLIYSTAGELRFPVLQPADPRSGFNESQMFRVAWRLEFTLQDPVAAAREYRNAARASTDPGVRLRAHLGAIRCLRKAGLANEALNLTEELLAQPLTLKDADLAQQMTHLRIQMAQAHQDQPQLQAEILGRLLVRLVSYNQEQALLPAPTRIYMLKKVLALTNPQHLETLTSQITAARYILQAEELCLELGETYPNLPQLGTWPDFQLRDLDPNEGLYGFQVKALENTLLVVLRRDSLIRCMQEWIGSVLPSNLACRLVQDDQERWTRYANDPQPVLMTIPFSDYLPGWNLEILTPSGSSLDRLARQQITIYLRIGALVISAMALLGIVLTVTLRRQARLHRLKNDFIATVTHELKTPLASMRLLVDTLLEGRYRDPQQVTEYLQLVSKENTRLTGLIDNFLTFSRMERNKQTFSMTPTAGHLMALDAIEAMHTKLVNASCQFSMDIPDTLPHVRVDHDAWVTVLVNLLDNAYKYSGEQKEIHLRAWTQNKRLYYAVTDKGFGIPRYAQKRIFHKFYQVDRRLTGHIKGCGLGLSIVKFIVQAHQGRIRVESKIGKGSTFTIDLPTVE